MDFSICSYSFHRWFADGKMDIFEYIEWNRENGFTLLDPWNVHLDAGYSDDAFLGAVKHAAERAGLPFGCVAVDGAHIYEPTAEARAENRAKAYRWIDICQYLGARQVRIDTGGSDEMPDDVFAIIVDGYADVLEYAGKRGVEVIVENHWGPTKHPKNVVKLLDRVEGLGLLFDTNNWAPGVQEQAWEMCAKYAKLSHIKTFQFDEAGNDPSVDISHAIHLLQQTGYSGPWGIESVPVDGDEGTGALKTLKLIRRVLGDTGGVA